MAITLTRRQLYELVWSEPTQQLAKQIGISDVAIAKHCRKAGIPMPGRLLEQAASGKARYQDSASRTRLRGMRSTKPFHGGTKRDLPVTLAVTGHRSRSG